MISVDEALALVLQHKFNYGIEEVPILHSVGRVLAIDIEADRDYPAFDRVMMDGIAISTRGLENNNSFVIQATQGAGDVPLKLTDDNCCIEIMTGASLPLGADAIIPYEELVISANIATLTTPNVKQFQNIHKQATDCKKGHVLLMQNTRITAGHIGILASVGMYMVPVRKVPRVAICSTGNELVEINEQPLPYQIRKSNSCMLAAALLNEGIIAALHHFKDDEAIMKKALADVIADNDVVLLSGAVSKGKYDYLPAVLTNFGMTTIFHRIAQRPGKPLLFGKCPNSTIIFGFPGNPMSTFVCYHIYFKTWLYNCLHYKPCVITARLASNMVFTPNLSYHVPVILKADAGNLVAIPVPGSNSGDIPSLAAAEGLITLSPEKSNFEAGFLLNVITCK